MYMSDDPGRDVVIFTEALKRPTAERGAFLDQACGGDAELRRKVEALLRAYERLGDFLETPPPKDAAIDEEPPGPNVNNGDSNNK
jgi:hypothetical protein